MDGVGCTGHLPENLPYTPPPPRKEASTHAPPPTPQPLGDALRVDLFGSEKMTFPEIFDLSFVKLMVLSQYSVSAPAPFKGR